MNFRSFLFALFFTLVFSDPAAAQAYKLVWADEFNGTQLDLTAWTRETGATGWGNNELEYYTDRTDNSFVSNGVLTIKAMAESYGGSNYTSARLKTQLKKFFKYGKIEANIQLPYGQGIWPAFWMLGENISTIGWPSCGELDIMELIGGGTGRDNKIYGTAHWNNNGHQSYGLTYTLPSGNFCDAFHRFSVTWSPTKIEWYMDDTKFCSLDISDPAYSAFKENMFILLNLAVGGSFPGYPNSSTVFPQTMKVDYVRVYQDTLAGSSPLALPVDFESATTNYSFTDFDGGSASRIANPQISGINTSAKVGKMIKGAGQTWAGSYLSLDSPIDFSSNKLFKVKVFMPRAGAKLLLKVENATNGSISYEKEVAGTVANQWEELTFDYSTINASNSYQHIVLIFDNGTAGDGSANYTYLFDDIRLTSAAASLSQMTLPVTFDDATVNYGVLGFGGAEGSSIVSDPVSASNKVCKAIKSATAELWAGTTITALTGGVQTGFSSAIPFTADAKKMNIRVYSPHSGIKIRLKVESYLEPGKSVETEVTNTLVNQWETLTFDFANQAAGTAPLNLSYSYNKASIFFNFGVTGATAGEKTYYFDDLKFGAPAAVATLATLPVDFESATTNYTFTDFDGGSAAQVSNPLVSGINTSSKVAKMIKGSGQTWAGSYLPLASAMDFSTNKIFKVKVFMPRTGAKLLLKVENSANAGIYYQQEAACTTANAWEELTFDYSGIDAGQQCQRLVFIFDLGTSGNGSSSFTYYFDDIRLTSAPVISQMNLPVTFDSQTINYGVIGFGGAEVSSITTDPTSASNNVVKVIKSASAQTWAGTTITAVTGSVATGFSEKVPFTVSEKRMNVRVWSPDAGIRVRLKAESYLDPTKSVETDAFTTAAGAWQMLEFNFGNQATGTAAINLAYYYNKVSIFFNFGVTGSAAGQKTYYFDDVKFGPAVTKLTLNLTALIEGFYNGSTAVQDTMTAQLCKPSSPYQSVASASAVSAANGSMTFSFPGLSVDSSYYVALKHRNALETWSALPVAFSAGQATYSFTDSASRAYGANQILKSARYCFYSGDANQDGSVEASDLLLIDTDNLNFASGYSSTDINGDGQVEATDLLITDTNNLNFISKVTPAMKKVIGRMVHGQGRHGDR